MKIKSASAAVSAFATACLLALVAAPSALASGWLGDPTDKTITFLFFGVIALFPILVTVLSIIQGKLEARKERRRYDLERYS